ncbi:MAG TPA: T9SS type A sorting domain-containing protein, partial [Flavobacteriales bacterium]|nr:T9SS type A sorting domain-containing protein [Flavobacteriales bacterium]
EEPAGAWKLKTYTLPGSITSQSKVRFRFRYTSGAFSGNLYIDDIWIGQAVGVEELAADDHISLFPNPTNDHFTLQVRGMETSATEITITDLRGAVVYQNKVQPAGGANIEISGREIGLAEGMYMLQASNNQGRFTKKLVMGH